MSIVPWKFIRIVAATLAASMLCVAVAAQGSGMLLGARQPYSEFRTVALTVDAGSVLAMAQDERGMMWIGTRSGLYSYDAYRLHLYCPDFDTNAHVVNQVLPATDGRLFLGTDWGLLCFDTENKTFHKVLSDVPTMRVRALAMMGTTLFVGTDQNGLWAYSLADGTQRRIDIGGKPIPQIYDLEAVGRQLFVASYGGLACIGESARWISAGLPADVAINSLCHDAASASLWIGTERDGLFRYAMAGGKATRVSLYGAATVKSVMADGAGNVLCGSSEGLYIYNNVDGGLRHLRHSSHSASSIANDMVMSLYIDRDGNVWIGTDRGISFHARSTQTRTIPLASITADGQGNLFVSAIRGRDGTYWLGGENGLLRVSGQDAVWFRAGNGRHSLINNYIRRVYEDGDGQVWIATDGGVARYDGASDSFVYYTVCDRWHTADTRWSYDIADDGHGRLWIASYFGGLFVVGKHKFGHSSGGEVVADTMIAGSPVYQISRFDGQTMAANMHDGIAFIDMKSLKVSPTGAYDDIMTVCGGRVWYASGSHVRSIDRQGRREEISYSPGRSRRVHCFVAEEGSLWFTTAESVYRISLDTRAVSKQSGQAAGCKAGLFDRESHTILWGGNDCLVAQSTRSGLDADAAPRHTAVVSVSSAGGELLPGDDYELQRRADGSMTIRLRRRENISLELSQFDYSGLSGGEFYYNVSGSEGWNRVEGGSNILSLAGLSGGKHTIRLCHADPAATPNPLIDTVTVIMPYPWYASIWARIAYAIAAIVAVMLIVVAQNRRQKRKYERRERERMLELSSLKMDFFVNISHELKTPLSLIVAPIGKIMAELQGGKARKMLETVQDNALRLNYLICKILDFKRLEYESDDTLMPSRVDLCQLIKGCIGNFAAVCEEHRVEILFQSDTPQLVVDVDVIKVESIVINLVSNAIKHVADGTGRIRVSLSATSDMARIEVADNGAGVSEHDLPYIFERYFQSGGSNVGGSGIGLHIVKKFAELHGGVAEARNNGGLAVTITLSRHIGAEKLPPQAGIKAGSTAAGELSAMSKKSQDLVTPQPHNQKTILIIDDNSEILDFLNEELSQLYGCLTASDGEEGCRMVEEQQPDLVIVDQMMPQMDGMEFVRRMRRNAPTATLPIIMLTAKDDYRTEMESIRQGVDVFLPKPFDMKRLQLHIARLLKKRDTIERCRRIESIQEPDFAPEEPASGTDETLLKKITASIEGNMGKEGFSVEALAADVGVSQKQLYRKTKQLTGLTPVNYIRRLRMKKAYSLLSQPGFSVAEVCYMIGFSNVSYFSKCFVDEFGMSPRQLIAKASAENGGSGESEEE